MFKKNISEFLLIFISVLLAFFLTEWSSNRNEAISEQKLLVEINNGLTTDLSDLNKNMINHGYSLRGIAILRNWMQNKAVSQDSVDFYYNILFRNFTPIINKTGYESLKATSLKTISDDSLRFEIISLYDFHYKIIEKLEDQIEEMQDFKKFYKSTNDLIHPYLIFDKSGKITKITTPNQLTSMQKSELLSYLWKVEKNKKFKISRYEVILKKISEVKNKIERAI